VSLKHFPFKQQTKRNKPRVLFHCYIPFQRMDGDSGFLFILFCLSICLSVYLKVQYLLVLRWATGWTIGVLEFDSRRRLGTFLFTTASRTALGPTQPPLQWVAEALSLGKKRPGSEADHSPPSSAEIKELMELYLHSPIRLLGVMLS
jgi:hypothetical protein